MRLAFILFFLVVFSSYNEAQSDFRNLSWGMSLDDVKNHEKSPLTKEEKNSVGYRDGQEFYDGINLMYENVSVSGKSANIIYECKNGKLSKIRVVFQYALYGYDGKVSETISRFSDLYEGLAKSGFKFSSPLQCGDHVYSGADFTNPDNEKIKKMKNWSIDQEKLDLVDKMIAEKHYKAAFFKIENDRSRGSVMFLSSYNEWQKKTPVIFELTPSYKLEQENKNLGF